MIAPPSRLDIAQLTWNESGPGFGSIPSLGFKALSNHLWASQGFLPHHSCGVVVQPSASQKHRLSSQALPLVVNKWPTALAFLILTNPLTTVLSPLAPFCNSQAQVSMTKLAVAGATPAIQLLRLLPGWATSFFQAALEQNRASMVTLRTRLSGRLPLGRLQLGPQLERTVWPSESNCSNWPRFWSRVFRKSPTKGACHKQISPQEIHMGREPKP